MTALLTRLRAWLSYRRWRVSATPCEIRRHFARQAVTR